MQNTSRDKICPTVTRKYHVISQGISLRFQTERYRCASKPLSLKRVVTNENMNVLIDKTVLEKTIISPSYARAPARAAFSEHLKNNK